MLDSHPSHFTPGVSHHGVLLCFSLFLNFLVPSPSSSSSPSLVLFPLLPSRGVPLPPPCEGGGDGDGEAPKEMKSSCCSNWARSAVVAFEPAAADFGVEEEWEVEEAAAVAAEFAAFVTAVWRSFEVAVGVEVEVLGWFERPLMEREGTEEVEVEVEEGPGWGEGEGERLRCTRGRELLAILSLASLRESGSRARVRDEDEQFKVHNHNLARSPSRGTGKYGTEYSKDYQALYGPRWIYSLKPIRSSSSSSSLLSSF